MVSISSTYGFAKENLRLRRDLELSRAMLSRQGDPETKVRCVSAVVYGMSLGESGHFFASSTVHKAATPAAERIIKDSALARGMRKLVDLLEAFSPFSTILGSLSISEVTCVDDSEP